jgi:hypothetical protein
MTFESGTQATDFNRRRSTVIARTNANEPQKWVCRKLMTARHGEISTRGNENTGKIGKAFSLKPGSTVSGGRKEIESSR